MVSIGNSLNLKSFLTCFTTFHAVSQSIFSTSINTLISSGIASVGWVSFSYNIIGVKIHGLPHILVVLQNYYHVLFWIYSFYFIYLAIMSCIVADTNKYCCFNLNSLPMFVESSGYKTLVNVSAIPNHNFNFYFEIPRLLYNLQYWMMVNPNPSF